MNSSDFINNLSAKGALFMAATASVLLLAVALVAQYGFSLHPCELCMAQRYPYAVIVALGVIASAVKRPTILWRMALLAALLFVFDAGIAFYHAGVEWHIFPGPAACTNTESANASLEEMRREIMNAPLVACDQPMIHVLGLSMAAWNAIAAAVLAIATFYLLAKIRTREKHGV